MSTSDPSSTTPINHPLAAFATPLSPAETQPGTPTIEVGASPNVPLIRNHHETNNDNNSPTDEGKFSVIRSRPGNGNGREPVQPGASNRKFGGEYGEPGGFQDWEEEYERQKLKGWETKVNEDLQGWRGGHGTPRSAYPRQALPPKSYYNQPITGTIGRHLPKEIVRIERDWSGGEVCQ
ncbi:hypothetical protein I316_01169 [Kwoniella heveanensis BCC8398]|uniref:Uncharacterized protein n=1 Tax=Kwoniella heveanensis BCC8398 TaxID=1296120 RepID=A0A1B9H1V8_9TREE|nr:hypothetical protein I316_01169 [Kwoniella heveanensis BCC8398]